MSQIVDARGLSCPQPVLLTKKAVDKGEFPIEVMVDTVTSRENVRRMAENWGCKVQVEDFGEEFKLTLTK
ncbi:MAG: sulfurtransferase TusA family protein [candidate division KSB1 bacterium]|nr:sulfurtransferase TusA family protein [candidate division KSB1 bacterium]MDZ7356165.1 sulfurtransferase TusA family protein [candidate division KSB1 bacterium]MDZ7376874.1 sulfurtransferase TusA family protein [candidate division KSB1 bacterium]MDZ7400308.1 sulfurtransferase TusA family protein [candidate division KSB1 bacterium]